MPWLVLKVIKLSLTAELSILDLSAFDYAIQVLDPYPRRAPASKEFLFFGPFVCYTSVKVTILNEPTGVWRKRALLVEPTYGREEPFRRRPTLREIRIEWLD